MAGIFNLFTKKRKRKNNDLPDGNFSLPNPVTDDKENAFKRNGNYRSMRNYQGSDDKNFQRNGSVRRSLQNHKGILHMAQFFTSENRKLRQEKEFMARRVEFLEAEMKLKESNEPQTMHAQQSQIILQEKLELERQLKYSNECRAEMERCLTKECQRTAMLEESFKKTFDLMKRGEQTSENTNLTVKEIKTILLSSNDEYLRMLATVDKNTKMTLEHVNSLSRVTTFVSTFKDLKFDRLSENVKETFRLLGEIVGIRWPKLIIALGLSPEVIEYFRSEEQDCGCSQEEIVWRILCIWYKHSENGVSLTKLDQACLTVGIRIFSDKPMTQDQRVVIQNKYAELMEKMIDVWPLIPYLKKYSVIMPNVVEHIVTAKTRSDRIRRLIDSLVTLGDQGLHAFVRALDESGHKDLARGILAEEARLLSEAIQIPPNNLVSEQRQNENTDDNGETAILMQLQDKRFTDSEIHKKFDLPPPEVDTENCYPIGTRYFSDLKATMKHVESMLMEMAYRESLST